VGVFFPFGGKVMGWERGRGCCLESGFSQCSLCDILVRGGRVDPLTRGKTHLVSYIMGTIDPTPPEGAASFIEKGAYFLF